MRDAVIRDFSLLPEVAITVSWDDRLPKPQADSLVTITTGDNALEHWAKSFEMSDAVILIAPETKGVLYQLTKMVEQSGSTLLGCHSTAVVVASSKLLTCQVLQSAGVSVLPCYRWQDIPLNMNGPYVAKMDDGAGCEDSRIFKDFDSLDEFMQTRQETHVVQTYQEGTPVSISMLCKHGRAWLLSCNQQKISNGSGLFRYTGSILNGVDEFRAQFEQIAEQVAQAIPGLFAYVGIDLILEHGYCHVLEINPRLTTSYAGIHEAVSRNPARLILDLAYNNDFVMPQITRNRVEISLDGSS